MVEFLFSNIFKYNIFCVIRKGLVGFRIYRVKK